MPKTSQFLCFLTILFSFTFISHSQKYNKLFNNQYPQEKQILNLEPFINSTAIYIDANPQHSTYIDEPYSQIKNLIGVNFTYSSSDGFMSEWSEEKQQENGYNIVINNVEKIKKEQSKHPIVCESTSPQMVFKNQSCFVIEGMKKSPSSKVIINYEELLHEEDVVLDVWKIPSNKQNPNNFTFILVSNGQLLVVESSSSKSNNADSEIKQNINIHKIANQLTNAEFNDQKYLKQRKIYIFSNEAQVQIHFSQTQASKSKYTLKNMNISFKYPNMNIVDFEWIQNPDDHTFTQLVILTTTFMNVYSLNNQTQQYLPVQEKQVGLKQLMGFLQGPISVFTNEDGSSKIKFKKIFYLKEEKVFLIWENNFGIIPVRYRNQNDTNLNSSTNVFKVFGATSATKDCSEMELIRDDKNKELPRLTFILNCKNNMGRIQIQLKPNKISVSRTHYEDVQVPAGEIIIESTEEGNFVFVLGQTKIVGMVSWKYPKILDIANPYLDNLFLFGSDYVEVVDNQITLGNYEIVKEKVACRPNPNYKKYSQNGNDSSSTSQNQNLNQVTTSNDSLALFVEYIAQCNHQVLTSAPYYFTEENLAQKKYCRYKKSYPKVYLKENQVQTTKNSSQKLEFILIIVFAFSALVLLVGVGIWVIQKRKITAFLQEQGMPVGSEDLQANPNAENNLNHKLY